MSSSCPCCFLACCAVVDGDAKGDNRFRRFGKISFGNNIHLRFRGYDIPVRIRDIDILDDFIDLSNVCLA